MTTVDSAPDPGQQAPPEAGRAPSVRSLVTIVVPTFNERDNVDPLLRRLNRAMTGLPVDVLFVDDSTDDTQQVIERLAALSTVPVRVLHRPPAERRGGLGGAVVAGLRATTAEWVVVMDGDLQHPPELVRGMLDRAVSEQADVIVASRYLDGGGAAGLATTWRRRVSVGAAALARLLFPRRLTDCSDPMSGFFLLRRGAVPLDRLRPDGFKILLEILARSADMRVSEVPFHFAARASGASKADLAQGLVYVRHLLRLRTGGVSARLAGFLAIGLTGTLPNVATVELLSRLGVHYLVATAAATVVAATSNFLLTDSLLFRGRASRPRAERWFGYVALSAVDIVIRIPLLALLVGRWHMDLLAATALSILVAGVLRFVAVDRWLYRADVAIMGDSEALTSGGTGASAPEHDRVTQGPSRGHLLLREAILHAA